MNDLSDDRLCAVCVRDALAAGAPYGACFVDADKKQHACERLRSELRWRRSRWHPKNYKKSR